MGTLWPLSILVGVGQIRIGFLSRRTGYFDLSAGIHRAAPLGLKWPPGLPQHGVVGGWVDGSVWPDAPGRLGALPRTPGRYPFPAKRRGSNSTESESELAAQNGNRPAAPRWRWPLWAGWRARTAEGSRTGYRGDRGRRFRVSEPKTGRGGGGARVSWAFRQSVTRGGWKTVPHPRRPDRRRPPSSNAVAIATHLALSRALFRRPRLATTQAQRGVARSLKNPSLPSFFSFRFLFDVYIDKNSISTRVRLGFEPPFQHLSTNRHDPTPNAPGSPCPPVVAPPPAGVPPLELPTGGASVGELRLIRLPRAPWGPPGFPSTWRRVGCGPVFDKERANNDNTKFFISNP